MMSSDQTRYRFGLFEADPHTGSLVKQGRVVRLQEQPFQVLVALLERHGDLVTRGELRERLWPGDTFVEFDKSLGVALAKLRAALGDEASNPRFIETVPKRGYRFIAPLTVVQGTSARPVSNGPAASAPASAPQDVPVLPASTLSPRRMWPHLVLAASAVIVIVAAGVIYFRHATAGAHLTGRSGVVVATFTNATGDAVFDGSLRSAAMMGLAQSPYLHVLSDRSIGEILQGLGRPPDEPLSSGLAREACRRAGAAAIVDGSIGRSGHDYLLAVQASRCGDGSVLAEERMSVGSRDQIVGSLGRAIADLRRRLGEPDATLRSFNVPIDVATTDSLEALRAYQLGMELRARADNPKAIPALKTAIALDPQFAVAYAQLGSSYSNTGNDDEGKPFFRKAFELRDRVTAPERFYITGRYFDIVIGDLEKASDTYRAWTEVYPTDWMGFNALANDANRLGRFDVAANASRTTVALEPNQAFGYTNLGKALVGMRRIDDAKAVCRQELERFPDNPWAHLWLYAIGTLTRDTAATARELAWSSSHTENTDIPFEQAKWTLFQGRPDRASAMFEDVARRQRDAGNAETAAETLATRAEYEAMIGRTAAATATVEHALQLAHSEEVVGLGALVYALSGRTSAAEQLLEEAAEQRPLSTITMGLYSPMARAVLAGERRGAAPDDVTRALEPGAPYQWGLEAPLAPQYVRGLEYLHLHAWTNAARAFQDVIDHAGVDPASPIGALSYLGLARADAALGRRDASRKAYAIVLEWWKDAEPDFAPRAAASREYAALR